jgi:hypothetical protein
MLMKDKKKHLITSVISKLSPPIQESPQEESDEQSGMDAAAEEVLAAVEARDPQSLKEALKSMIQMCMDESEAEDVAYSESSSHEME